MKVAVWDTYVKRKDGRTMHFDIIVPEDLKDESTIYEFGRSYLRSKNEGEQELTAKQCRYCHIERASQEIETSIKQSGYYILEMENCN